MQVSVYVYVYVYVYGKPKGSALDKLNINMILRVIIFMGWWVGSRHLLTRVPHGEGGVSTSTPKYVGLGGGGGYGRVIQYWRP